MRVEGEGVFWILGLGFGVNGQLLGVTVRCVRFEVSGLRVEGLGGRVWSHGGRR